MIGFKPFSHNDYIIVGKTNFLVEGGYPIVSRTNLQIYFGVTHLSLLKGGMDKYFVYNIVIGGAIVGIACGYYYIKYNSFSAAIIVHFMANFTSLILSILKSRLLKSN